MEDSPKDEQVFKTYWRGLDKDDALVSFSAQMELLPKIWIIGQFVPALIFVSYLSIKFFGRPSFYKIYIENAVILVFALVTNISFFKRTWEDRKEEDVEDFSLDSHRSQSNDRETYSSGRYRTSSLLGWNIFFRWECQLGECFKAFIPANTFSCTIWFVFH